jgi:hypothetical protein
MSSEQKQNESNRASIPRVDDLELTSLEISFFFA